MKSFSYHPEAESEAIEAARYYNEKQKGLGMKFFDSLKNCIPSIQLSPQLFARQEWNCRKAMLEHFPYNIFFRIKNENIQIMAVSHTSREPGYWKVRVRSNEELS